MEGITAHARTVAPTPAWRENGINVRKVNVSTTAVQTSSGLVAGKRLLDKDGRFLMRALGVARKPAGNTVKY
jgi:hypothetical protein